METLSDSVPGAPGGRLHVAQGILRVMQRLRLQKRFGGQKVDEAERFYEEDEDPREVFAAFDAAEKGRTASPARRGYPSPWWARLRLEVAAVLRRLAKFIKPSHVRSA